MRAAQINEYGDPFVVEVKEVTQPTAGDGQVLVEVHSSSLNPFDTAIRAGYMKEMIPLELPVTLGGDIAGTIVAVGQGVDTFAEGDKVYGQANVVAGNSGAFAEFSATSANQVAKIPQNVDFNQAASLPLTGVSAWQGLVTHIGLKADQKIFIHGGSGGVGTIAIQIAKNIGAYVATTATGDGIDYVNQLGADKVIDYKTQDFVELLKDFDAVFDNVGGDDFTKTLSVLKPGGIAVSLAAQADEAKLSELQVTALTQMTHVTTDALNALTELVESGVVTPYIAKVFTLDQIQEAFTAREEGAIKGKVVLEIKV